MSIEQILKVLKNERECIKNNYDYCYEDCDESCPYYVSEKDKLEVYDHLISAYETTGYVVNISDEEAKALIEKLKRLKVSVYPMPDSMSYPSITTTDDKGQKISENLGQSITDNIKASLGIKSPGEQHTKDMEGLFTTREGDTD